MYLSPSRRTLLVNVIGACLYSMLLVNTFLHGSDTGRIDLKSTYWATQIAHTQDASPYGPNTFAEHGLDLDPLLYPPIALTIFSPLAKMDWEQTWFWVRLIIVACSIGTAIAIRIHIRQFLHGSLASAAYWGLNLVFLPVFSGLGIGQSDSILLALFLIGMWLQQKNKLLVPALLFSACISVRIYFALILPFIAIRRHWPALASTLLCLAILLAINILTLGSDIWIHWIEVMLPNSGYGKDIPGLKAEILLNQSMNGFWTRTLIEQGITQSGSGLRVLPYISSAFLVGAALLKLRNNSNPRANFLQDSALLLLTMCLASPLIWGSHFILSLPAAIWCLAVSCQSSGWRKWPYGLLAALLASNPILLGSYWVSPTAMIWPWSLAASGPFFTLLLAWALLMKYPRASAQ